jgi:hypothetical protein
MSRNVKRDHPGGSVRSWRGAAGTALAIASLAAFAAAAMAASPKTGCWGACGGDRGPVGGFFQVSQKKVESFAASAACLGRGSFGLENEVYGVPNMNVRAGKFSFTGTAKRSVTVHTSRPVRIALNGKFITSTRATVSLTIHYKSCRALHLTIRQVG